MPLYICIGNINFVELTFGANQTKQLLLIWQTKKKYVRASLQRQTWLHSSELENLQMKFVLLDWLLFCTHSFFDTTVKVFILK